MKRPRIIILVSVVIAALSAAPYARADVPSDTLSITDASVELPVTSVYAVETGAVSIIDTYLSPLKYKGTSMTVSGLWRKAMPVSPEKLTMDFDADIRFASALNPAGLASEYLFSCGFSWGINRRWRLPYDMQISAGAAVGFDAGVIYLPKNGNNPASAKFSLDFSLQAAASKRLIIGRLPVILSDRVVLPTLSPFFSPQFGESYYEIYIGNHKGLAHCGWWGNHFCIDNLLAADLDFGKTAMRIGYRFNVRSSYVSDINTQIVTHSFVIGVIPHGLGLKKITPSDKTQRIYAIY